MSKVTWAVDGSRLYEAGVDRGVLYVGAAAGVPWNGLISVTDAPSGGEPNSFYMDGVKYLSADTMSEFEGNIKAFYSPVEFDVCEGRAKLNGLAFNDQPRVAFGLTYRTGLGNDLKGLEYGYKIHIVYNAKVKPPSKDYVTANDSTEPVSLSWDFTTQGVRIAGRKPTAHLSVNSTLTTTARLTQVENILYGTASTAPRLPTPAELVTLFT